MVSGGALGPTPQMGLRAAAPVVVFDELGSDTVHLVTYQQTGSHDPLRNWSDGYNINLKQSDTSDIKLVKFVLTLDILSVKKQYQQHVFKMHDPYIKHLNKFEKY